MPTTKEQCANYEINSAQCPCANADCERHGICCECMAFHAERRKPTSCMKTPRPAATKSLPIGRNPTCAGRARNESICPCGEASCARHALCCDCVRFHWGHPVWPKTACM